MQKNFRILRNNKEIGPFSLEEVAALSLNPRDLVWVDGQSAGWQYPSEMDSLKNYIKPIESSGTEISKDNVPFHPASHVIRPQSNSIGNSHMQTISNVAPGNETTEDELTAEKLERKAAEIYQRIQAFTQQGGEEPQGSQTKYARSLEDLKQEYADWLHHKKNKKTIITKKNGFILGGSLVCLAALAFIFIPAKNNRQSNIIEPSKPYISNAVYSRHEAELPKQQVVTASEPKKIVVGAPLIKNAGEAQIKPSSAKELSVDKFIDSVERVLAIQDKQSQLLHMATMRSRHKTIEKKPEVAVIQEPKLEITKPDKKITPLSELVNMNAKYMYDANQQLFGLEVTIQNKSIQVLKTVSVDVFYYKKGGKLFDKETLYFTNIQPGNSFTLSTPGNRKAASARFQIGQITSVMN